MKVNVPCSICGKDRWFKQRIDAEAECRNCVPLGTIRYPQPSAKRQIVYIKTEIGWRGAAIVLLEKELGIPLKASQVRYRDGNHLNIDLSNLVAHIRKAGNCIECGEQLSPNKRASKNTDLCRKCAFRKQGKRNKFGKNNPFYGKEHTQETKNKISKCRKEKIQNGELQLIRGRFYAI